MPQNMGADQGLYCLLIGISVQIDKIGNIYQKPLNLEMDPSKHQNDVDEQVHLSKRV